MDLKFSAVTRKGPVTIVTLSRPEVYNALHTDAHFVVRKAAQNVVSIKVGRQGQVKQPNVGM